MLVEIHRIVSKLETEGTFLKLLSSGSNRVDLERYVQQLRDFIQMLTLSGVQQLQEKLGVVDASAVPEKSSVQMSSSAEGQRSGSPGPPPQVKLDRGRCRDVSIAQSFCMSPCDACARATF